MQSSRKIWALVAASCTALSCGRDAAEARDETSRDDEGMQRVPESDGARLPSEDMASEFEGRASARLTRPGGTVELRVLSRGDRVRIQVSEEDHPEQALDLLFDDDRAAALLNDKKEYFDVDLDDIDVDSADRAEVTMTASTEDVRQRVRGLTCNPRELSQPGQKIAACVLGLPNSFDARAFEALSGIDIPAWVEYLFERDLWPVTARVTDEQGKVLYNLELVEYTSRPLPGRAELTIPADFKRVEPRLPIFN